MTNSTKVTLTPINKNNFHLIRQWRNRHRHAFNHSRRITPKQHHQWLEQYLQDPSQKQYLVIYHHRHVGTLGIILDNPSKPEVGRLILGDSRLKGKGVMSLAIQQLFKLHPAPAYRAQVLKTNPAALKFNQKNGWYLVGSNQTHYFIEHDGIQPDTTHYTPLLKPSVSQDEIRAVTQVLESGWWGLGPVTAQLEKEFAVRTQTKHAIALNSATSALHLAVKILKGKKKIGNIVTTPLTFASTAAAGLYENLEVRFADIDPNTLCLNRDQALSLADHNTIAIIPVHYAGRLAPTDYDTYQVIEDCAHVAGHPQAGQSGIFSTWSFHPVKNIATGDGGMLTTNNDTFAQKAKKLRWLGIDQDTWSREAGGYNWQYTIKELGYKYHSNDILSAIALAQLRRLDELNLKRAKLARRYSKALKDLPLTLPQDQKVWHLYVIRLPANLRNPFINYLRSHHIAVGVHYQPLHHYPVFKWQKPLPATDQVFPTLADLPLYPDLTYKQQDYIIATIHQFFQQHS